jgi:hypothetical protein
MNKLTESQNVSKGQQAELEQESGNLPPQFLHEIVGIALDNIQAAAVELDVPALGDAVKSAVAITQIAERFAYGDKSDVDMAEVAKQVPILAWSLTHMDEQIDDGHIVFEDDKQSAKYDVNKTPRENMDNIVKI